jgi:SAM-dependent methyltransferase
MTSGASNQDQIDYWNGEAGRRWTAEQERLDAMMAETSLALLDAADPQSGEQILDVGCGCGSTSIAYGEAVGPKGQVLGLDVSEPMLGLARKRAAQHDLPNVTFVRADAAAHDLKPESYDLVASRFGVMFFADPVMAFRNLRKALKPSGRLAFVCWRDWRENEWVRVPVTAVRPHVPAQPPLEPDAPGPFAFASLGRIRTILAAAGFDQITARPLDVAGEFGDSLDAAVDYMQGFGPISRMLTPASELERERAKRALREALDSYAQRALPVTMGLAQWIVTAKAGHTAWA